jgi:cytochrome P450
MNQHNGKFMLAVGAISTVGLVGAAIAAQRMLARRGTTDTSLPKASILDTLAVIMEVFVPNVAKGVIIRRPKVVGMAERLGLDRRAVKRMQKLHNKYGTGPLMLRLPLRSQAVLLAPQHVHRVLAGSPEPFATASSEKRAALAHFEPKGVLISHGPARADRRRYNEEVLDSDNPVHRIAESFLPMVEQEAAEMLNAARVRGELIWEEFSEGWFRLVRRVVFGNGAREDHALTQMMAELRGAGNWAFLRPPNAGLRERFFARMKEYFDRAEPGSLAAVMAGTRTTEKTMPHHQVPQWLFAFDPAGMATFRALALLAAHPEQAARAQDEIRNHPGMERQLLPFLRATVLESLRLWPTTPLVLRQTTKETSWENGVMPVHTGVMIFAPFFHRDDQHLEHADRFAPELWLKERTDKDWPLIPFSEGPAVCPGRNLVLMLSSAMLASLLEGRQVRLQSANRLSKEKLPGTLNNYSLRFKIDKQAAPNSVSAHAQMSEAVAAVDTITR